MFPTTTFRPDFSDDIDPSAPAWPDDDAVQMAAEARLDADPAFHAARRELHRSANRLALRFGIDGLIHAQTSIPLTDRGHVRLAAALTRSDGDAA